jgi:hypothetical protein
VEEKQTNEGGKMEKKERKAINSDALRQRCVLDSRDILSYD